MSEGTFDRPSSGGASDGTSGGRSGSRCTKCGAERPTGPNGRCPSCLLQIALEEPQPIQWLGAYEIVSRLGTGGMGVVYRARDSRLDREVAIKVLPDDVASDPERIARFRREARVAASLNHPNIAAVYGFEDEGDAHFLVMELVEGPTLGERLKAGALPVDEALAIIEQVAEGLEAAHDRGIVHRDLKPANIKITPDGKAKILDFGLARSAVQPTAETDLEHSPTITAHRTTPGIVLGTIPYMSPEQARGRTVDKRSDIWALGCVLYECLAGRRAFDGDTATDVLAKILERDPDWDALPSRTPPRVRELLERCLEKDLKHRARDSGDIRIELERARAAREWTTSGAVRAWRMGRTRFRSVLPWSVAALTTVVAVASLALLWYRDRTVSNAGRTHGAPLHVDVTDPDTPHVPYEEASTLAVSPDGMLIAYVGRSSQDPEGIALFTRRADEIQSRRIDLKCKDGVMYDPFFSPDGKWLGCTCKGIYKVPLSGGEPVLLTESLSPSKGATWSSRGVIYAPAAKSGLVLVREEGGPLQTLTVPDASKGEVSHRWPSALPDGRHVLFTIKKEGITSFDLGEIALLDLDSGSWKTLIQGGSFARYLPTGQIVFARGDTILAVAFDLRRERVQGDPVPILNGVMTQPGSGAAQYAVAQDAGTLVFVPGGPVAGRYELDWIDRKGSITPLGAPLLPFENPTLSPDGTRVAATIFGATDVIGVYELARRSLTRLPVRGNCAFIDWTPDSRQVLFGSDMDGLGKQTLFLAQADGTGQPQRVSLDVLPVYAKRVARLPQGLGLIHYSNNIAGFSRLEGDTSFQPLGGQVRTGAEFASGFDVSLDGRWLAYDSRESGRSEIHVTSFPAGGGNWQVTHDGGVWPHWSPRGDEIVYYHGEIVYSRALGLQSWTRQGGDVWLSSLRVSIKEGQITASEPTDLFKVPPGLLVRGFHPDGTRLLVVRTLPPEFKGDRIVAILNWADQVQARTAVQ